MLKAILNKEAHGNLSEELQGEYKEGVDGSFVLDVEAVNGTALENVVGLKNTVNTLRSEIGTLKNTVKKFDGIDPEVAKSAMDTVSGLEGMSVSEKVEAATKSKQTALISQHKKDMEAKDKTLSVAMKQLQTQLVTNAIGTALDELGGDKVVLPSFISKSVKMIENENGQLVARVFDEQGNERVADGLGTPLSVNDYVSELSKSDMYASYFKGTGASGSGGSGSSASGGSSGSPGIKTIGGIAQIPASDQNAVNANQADIASGKAVVVDG